MNRFSQPNASDDLANCDSCGFEANHEMLHWDDSSLVYRCHYCQQRHLEKVMIAMEAKVLDDDSSQSNLIPHPSPGSQSKPPPPLAPGDGAGVAGQ